MTTNILKPFRPIKVKPIMNAKNNHWPIFFRLTHTRLCRKTLTVMGPLTKFFTSQSLKLCTVKTELAKKYFWLICAVLRTKSLCKNYTHQRNQLQNLGSFSNTTNTTSTIQRFLEKIILRLFTTFTKKRNTYNIKNLRPFSISMMVGIPWAITQWVATSQLTPKNLLKKIRKLFTLWISFKQNQAIKTISLNPKPFSNSTPILKKSSKKWTILT